MKKSKDVWLGPQMDAVAREVSKLAIALDIDIDGTGVWERVLKNDESICGRRNPKAFRQIREHLMVLFGLEERALERFGAEELNEIVNRVRTSIRTLRAVGSGDRDATGDN